MAHNTGISAIQTYTYLYTHKQTDGYADTIRIYNTPAHIYHTYRHTPKKYNTTQPAYNIIHNNIHTQKRSIRQHTQFHSFPQTQTQTYPHKSIALSPPNTHRHKHRHPHKTIPPPTAIHTPPLPSPPRHDYSKKTIQQHLLYPHRTQHLNLC